MKKFIKFLLFFAIIIAFQTATAKEQATTDSKETDLVEHAQTEENDPTVTDFLIEEVVPAFGGFEQLFLTNTPSFNIQFTQDGIELKDCSLEIKLKQLKTIQYQVTDSDTDGFPVNLNIGQPRWLFFNASCEEQDTEADTNYLNISFTIKDENLEDSYYELVFNAFDKEQLTIKLYSIQLGALFKEVDQEILLSSHGDVMNFSKELKGYKSADDTYSLPIELWEPLNNKLRSAVQNNNDFIELRKVKITQIINIDGVVNLTFPTSVNNITENTNVSAPIMGQIFVPEEEEENIIPIIDFSFQ